MTAAQLTLDGVLRPHRNHGLFSDHFLDARLRASQHWPAVVREAATALERLQTLWAAKGTLLPQLSEAQLEDEFVRPVLRDVLGHPVTVQPTLQTPFGAKRPDSVLCATQADADALVGQTVTADMLRTRGRAVVEVKGWGVRLDVAGASSDGQGLTTNPAGQIAFYILHAGLRWGILTDGRFWRLYHTATAHQLDRFYEVDLAELIARNDVDAFTYFYAFFRAGAFAAEGLTADAVLAQSAEYATGVGDSLKTQVFGAVRHLAQGFVDAASTPVAPTPEALQTIYANALIVLYRLLFVAYAEARGLLPLQTNAQYRLHYSLFRRIREAAERRDGARPLLPTTTTVWNQLRTLFVMVDKGHPPLSIGTFNGGLFDEDKHPFLVQHQIGDVHLDAALDLIGRVAGEYVDYRDLATRHLGSIYEGLLEFHLAALETPEAGERGEVFTVALVNDAGERRSSGSFYTPDYIVEHIVAETLGPVVQDACVGAADDVAKADRILALNVLDTAMGSAHFLVEATDFLARQLAALDIPTAADLAPGEAATVAYWRRRVAHACIYGVDVNPLAVELAKLSLWLTTAALDRPLSFLDHHLRCGNSLLGGRLADVQQRRALFATPARRRRKRAEDESQIHFLDLDTFRASMGEAVRSMTAIEAAVGQTVAEVKEQERAYAVLRGSVEQRFKRALDMSAAMALGHHVDQSLIGALFQHLTGGVSLMVPTMERHAEQAAAMAAAFNFFHWEIEFPDVFFDADGRPLGESAGFDAVIGNPPYDVLAARERGEATAAAARFLAYAKRDPVLQQVMGRKVDLFRLFMAQSLMLGRPGAAAGFIVPMSILADQQAASLRALLLSRHALRTVHAFPQKDDRRHRVFPEAKLPTCVVALTCRAESDDPLEVVLHPGRTFEDVTGRYHTTREAIRTSDPTQLRIPIFTSDAAASLTARLRLAPGYCTIGALVSTSQGEINETTMAGLLSETPGTGALVLRGSNVQRYRFVPVARQGTSKYLDEAQYHATVGGERIADTMRPRFGYQRNSALDSSRRLLVCELPTPSYCFDSIAYIPIDGVKYPYAVMAFLNSDLLEWLFRQTSTNNHVSAAQLLGLPAVSMQPGMGRGTRASELRSITASVDAVVAGAEGAAVAALLDAVRVALTRTPAGVDAALVALDGLARGMLDVVRQHRDAVERFALDLEGVLPDGALDTLQRLWTPISARSRSADADARRAEGEARLGALARRALPFEDVDRLNEDQWRWVVRQRLGAIQGFAATVMAFRQHQPTLAALAQRRDRIDQLINTIVFDCFRVTDDERALVARELH